MPCSTHHSLKGRLVATRHGFALDTDSGGRWRLDITDPHAAAWLVSKQVVVTGTRAGVDLLDVDMIILPD
ncbi:DUF5818 domain-containing protein [Polymorphobacter sp. PAMC 29334]|uniref:DUF5818 domain-containing protein n=1 Tax=Polymorphobacter sp. PAMC 29334 TaxID=2862331 RepID=UPI001C935E6A